MNRNFFVRQTAKNYNRGYPAAPLFFQMPNFAQRIPCVPPPRTALQRAGWNFQASLAKRLAGQMPPGWHVLEDLWLEYQTPKGMKHAGPDIILLNIREGKIIVIESKLSLTDCYKQLWLYMALLRKMFPKPLWRVSGWMVYKRHREGVVITGPAEFWYGGIQELDSLNWDGIGHPVMGVLQDDGIRLWAK